MRTFMKMLWIGFIAGTGLALFLIIIYIWTDNRAYVLLFNVDYIPVLRDLQPRFWTEIAFHYLFCMVSVIGLFYTLRIVHKEKQLSYYILVYTGGSALLFSLTVLSTAPPVVTDVLAWTYWTLGHALYSLIVGMLIKKWV